MVTVGANLRTLVASLPPLVRTIASDLGLSSTAIGVLTTLPVLCMGVFAPAAHALSRRFGAPIAVAVALVLLLSGTLLRGLGSVGWPLYVGTLLGGVGIAVAGTLVPGLVKQLVPAARAGLATGLTMGAMMGGAALASALAVPAETLFGSWQASLASWSVLVAVGIAGWFPLVRRVHGGSAHVPADEAADHGLPFRHVTAWLLTGFLAAQSVQFYSSLAWLAPTYVAEGWSPRSAGFLLSWFTAAQVVSGLLGPAVADRVRDLRWLLVPVALCALSGLVGLWLAPQAAPWAWAALLGLGQGASFALGLVMLIRYAGSPAASARLSAMGLGIGYLVASAGPTVTGAIREVSGGFAAVWLALAAVLLVQLTLAVLLGPHRPPIR
jgi:CP family cyanate transporter-like MFS transporter